MRWQSQQRHLTSADELRLLKMLDEFEEVRRIAHHRAHCEAVSISLTAGPIQPQKEPPLATITTAQKFVAHVAGLDSAGNKVPLVSATWSSSDATIITVTAQAADQFSADVVGIAAGTANVLCSAEGDPTPGKDTLSTTDAVTVTLAVVEAASIVISEDPPTAK
jgi:hypothetical protein